MLLIAIGSRQWNDQERLFRACDGLRAEFPINEVWSGGARGADALARAWAQATGLKFREWPANWQRHRGGAGFQRTAEMIDQAPQDALVACFVPVTLGESRGSAFSVQRAQRRGLRVYLVQHSGGAWLAPPAPAPSAGPS